METEDGGSLELHEGERQVKKQEDEHQSQRNKIDQMIKEGGQLKEKEMI